MHEQPRRKPRIHLSPEELFYVIELKKIKQLQKLEAFKATLFFKIINRLNIFFAAFLTYCILSILILSSWQKAYVSHAICKYDDYIPEMKQRTIGDIQLDLTSGEYIHIITSNLFHKPQANDVVFVGKDFLFRKTLKVKFETEDQVFFGVNSYADLTVCGFALLMGFFIYKVNKHYTINGLFITLSMFMLASFYFVLV
jgi:hypothetical protein